MNETTKIADTKLAASTKAAIKEHFPYAVTLGDLKQCISDDPKALDCFTPRTIDIIMNILDFTDYDSPASKLSGARTFLISDGAANPARLAAGMSRASDEEDKTDIVRESFIGSGCLGFGAYEYSQKGVSLVESSASGKKTLARFTWKEIAQELEVMINEGYDFGISTPVTKQNTPTDTAAFDYSAVDDDTAQYLRKATARIANSYADIGAVLAEAQERLAHNNNGIFEKWFTSLGMSKMTVYRFIQIHNFRSEMLNSSQFGTNQLDLFDNLPKTLQADISSPSAPAEAVNAVLSGDITTHKDFIAMKKELEESQAENEQLTEKNKFLSMDYAHEKERNERMLDELKEFREKSTELEAELRELRSRPVETVTIESDPRESEAYKAILDERNKMHRQVVATTQENDRLKDRCDELSRRNAELNNQPQITGGFDSEQLRDFFEDYYSRANDAVRNLYQFIRDGYPQEIRDYVRGRIDDLKDYIENLEAIHEEDFTL